MLLVFCYKTLYFWSSRTPKILQKWNTCLDSKNNCETKHQELYYDLLSTVSLHEIKPRSMERTRIRINLSVYLYLENVYVKVLRMKRFVYECKVPLFLFPLLLVLNEMHNYI